MLTLSGTSLIVIAVVLTGAFAGCYALLLARLRSMMTDRQLKVADQIASLDSAIRALETRLAQHQQQKLSQSSDKDGVTGIGEASSSGLTDEESMIAPEIRVAIAAAAVAAAGPSAVVHSVKPVTSPWTQQGRVLVQGGHNLRVQR